MDTDTDESTSSTPADHHEDTSKYIPLGRKHLEPVIRDLSSSLSASELKVLAGKLGHDVHKSGSHELTKLALRNTMAHLPTMGFSVSARERTRMALRNLLNSSQH